MDYSQVILEGQRVGCTNEQMVQFLTSGYMPQPKQMLFHAAGRAADLAGGPRHIGFGGARGPGKSHAMYAQVTLDDCQRFPGLEVLFVRKVSKALHESMGKLRRKVLKFTPHAYSKVSGMITFENGSTVRLGHFRDDSSFDALIGQEYDVVAVEEATTLTSEKYKMLNTCCRTSKSGWRPRIYSNANPGGVGHGYYYRKFVKGSQTTDDVMFIPATYKDNVFLDVDYVKTLEELSGWLRRAWLYGDWNIHAGQYFSNFEEAIHVFKLTDVKGQNYQFHLAVDYGFQHPTAAVLLATSGNDVAVVDEYLASKQLTHQHSRSLDAILAKWKLTRRDVQSFTLGADAWRKGKEGTCVADEYEVEGWEPQQAVMARVIGAQEVLRRLGDSEALIAPHLWINSSCARLVEQIQQMQHNPRHPEDVLKVDVDDDGEGGDDLYDALRYGLQAIVAYNRPVVMKSIYFRR